MIGMGTVVNMASIILGGIIGIIIKDRLKDGIRDTIMNGIGLAVIFIGISGSLQEGLTGNASTLFAKALIDGIAALVFTSTLGICISESRTIRGRF